MKRKLLSVLLTLCLAFSLLPTAALADEEGAEGGQTKDVAQIGSTKYASLTEAIKAAEGGATITLLADINTPETSYYIQKSLTIDLGGKTLTGSGYDGVFNIEGENAAVLIKNGKIVAVEQTGTAGKYTMAVWACAAGCKVTLEDLDVSQQITHTDDKQMDMIYTSKGTIIINSGCFASGTPAWTLNCKDSAYKDGTAKIIVNGGTFDGYDPRNAENEGKGTSLVADGVGVDANSDGTFTAKSGMVAQIVDADGNSVAAYDAHFDAIAAAKDGETVILLSDRKNYVTNTIDKNITIDLNGKTLSVGNNNPFFCTNGEVTIQNGAINSNLECVIVNAYNKLTLKNVQITGVTGDNGKNLVNVCSNAEVTIDKDTVLTASGRGVAVFIGQDADAKYTLNVYGKLIQQDKSFAICGNGSYKGTTTINIYDGAEVKSASAAIYQPQAGAINVTGGLVEGYCAIGIKSGMLNISGGTVRGTANDYVLSDENSNGDGLSYDGSAIIVDSRSAGYAGNVKINVTGGTVESRYSTAIREIGEQDKPDMTQLVELNVTGGNVLGAGSNTGNVTNDMLVRDVSVKNVSVSGGTFNHEVQSDYCADKFVPVNNNDGTYGVKINENMAAEVLDAQGKTVGAYDTLAAAITAAKNGETVKLLKDVELTSTLNLAKNITIDGQGKYTIKAANNFIVGKDNNTCCVLYVSGEVTLKDVTVNGNEKCRVIFCDKGKLTIDGATITNGKAPNFIGGVYMTSSASFEMKSGSITGNKNAELYQNEKYLQYSSDLWIGANANGALTAINGGTIGNVFVNANKWSASNPGSFTMNGGTVTNLYVEHDANYGATFKYNDGTIEHLYLSKENGNGQSIEVTPVKGVIYNGGVKEQDLVTLTMKYNDGATADSTYNVASGTTITLPTPKRSGYTFNGWYDGSTKVSSPYEVTKNVTLTASWSYNYSGGSSSYDPTYSVSTPSKTENGTVTVSPKNASKGDRVTVTVKPDSGYVLETLTVTDKNGNELTLKDKGNGKYTFTMPAGKVEVKATFMEDNSMLNFFYDVPNNAYFYEAVKWAVKNGITTGVGNNLFAPEQPCTRAQIVTFLWRAAGSPEPKGAASGMTDVVSGSYYEKAVAWAIENGITTGTTTSTFSPDVTCTRAQAVTFLARALKAKAASAAEFSDVPTDSYFADAVAWAAANGVTEGIGGGLFGSDNDCTRGQIVTFLYRAYNK